MPGQTDVLVVGGGVIGAAVAYALSAAGAQVVLLDREQVASGASGGATGMVWTSGALERHDAWFELQLAASNEYAALAERLREESGLDVEYHASGMLRVAYEPDDGALWQARGGWLREAGVRAEWLEPRQARELEPGVSAHIVGGLWFPEAAQVRSKRVTQALARAAALRGADIHESCPALRLERRGGRVVGARTAEGLVEAEWTVLAAGPWCNSLLGELDSSLPLAPVKGQLVLAAGRHHWPRNMLSSEEVSLVPRLDGELSIGSTQEDAGFDARPTLDAVVKLVGAAERLLPGVARLALQSVWAGLRPAAPHRRPIVGLVDGCERLIVATAHHRSGVLLGPMTGRLVAQLIASSGRDPHTPEANLFRNVGALRAGASEE